MPALVRALKDKDPFIRETAAGALARIGPAAKQGAPDVIALLEQKNRLSNTGGPWSPSSKSEGRSRRGSFALRGAL